jgi:hypothetical protein
VHDDLYARSLVIEGVDKTPVVMMTLGIINFGFENQEKIRAKIQAATGIPPDNVLISCTHTHSDPPQDTVRRYHFVIDGRQKAPSTPDGASGAASARARPPSSSSAGTTSGWNTASTPTKFGLTVETPGPPLGVVFNYGCHPST